MSWVNYVSESDLASVQPRHGYLLRIRGSIYGRYRIKIIIIKNKHHGINARSKAAKLLYHNHDTTVQ